MAVADGREDYGRGSVRPVRRSEWLDGRRGKNFVIIEIFTTTPCMEGKSQLAHRNKRVPYVETVVFY